ncbi:MAG TPA: MoaD/ThiS family protein [Chitinophagaceae bacterium]|nr:MoaD/ThiS family protein [Chitinophagaceae bacterium]
MKVNVLIFGQLKEITNTGALVVEDVSDTDQLISQMKNKYPQLSDSKFVISVDKKIVNQNVELNGGSTIALLPPFSGG